MIHNILDLNRTSRAERRLINPFPSIIHISMVGIYLYLMPDTAERKKLFKYNKLQLQLRDILT